MSSFSLNAVPGIVSGAGKVEDLGRILHDLRLGTCSVFLVADPGLTHLGMTKRVAEIMKDAGHRVVTFADIKSDPSEAQVRAAVATAREKGAEAIVCLGGGSALDAGKLIASLIGAQGDVSDYRLGASPLPVARVPLVCVPTTAGTGSEATAVSIVSGEDGSKYWFWAPSLKPDAVVLDPELTTGLPAHLTAACGIDAIVHAMEAATNANAFETNNRVCLDAINLGARHLPTAVSEPNNIGARAGMLLSATYAGIGIDNAGTGIAHNVAHALGSLVPIHHGRAVAVAMCATLCWSMEKDKLRYTDVARAFGCERTGELPMSFAAFVRRLGITMNLEEELPFLAPSRLAEQMARPENAAMRAASYREASDDDLLLLAERTLAFR
ncbi:iron-containing alcohol dehydrogenase [Rhizobiales bacterium]|uniref:iron-containing alcohol dehydrogenase n=1 Tax=Hongsoonwoonella zoysiae TaxID=2821844 RepID=UPI00155F5567|nr:iron-containing alcohol dehydrogenase [Hongsoonwoonella zoysiae]NRG18567.1 iron-containing alcohol dehydrogenase [Hongsoonwoonella zoysiae]